MVNSWQLRFRKVTLEKLVNPKFSQFHSLSTALSTIPSGKIWNIVPLWCCFTSPTAGYPVDFLYSSAHIRKTEHRFPLMVLNCKKKKNTTKQSEYATNLVGVCLLYESIILYVWIQLSPIVFCCPHANPTEERKTRAMKSKIFSPFSPQKKLADKNTNYKNSCKDDKWKKLVTDPQKCKVTIENCSLPNKRPRITNTVAVVPTRETQTYRPQ